MVNILESQIGVGEMQESGGDFESLATGELRVVPETRRQRGHEKRVRQMAPRAQGGPRLRLDLARSDSSSGDDQEGEQVAAALGIARARRNMSHDSLDGGSSRDMGVPMPYSAAAADTAAPWAPVATDESVIEVAVEKEVEAAGNRIC